LITIIDYDAGNLRSISNMLRVLGVRSQFTRDPLLLSRADKLILPGVGHFDYGMTQLKQSGLIPVLNELVLEKRVPILGICLGAQLLTRGSDEGSEPGLGWIEAETIRFDRSMLGSNLRVPHMGWADTEFASSHPLFRGFNETPRFYYVHSFHLSCDSPETEFSWATHGYRFVSGIGRDNIWGVQFHPEKSHRFGKQLLKNFAEL
jgi:imidazole glycerol-phosphate synthase subunit HisH